MISGRYTYIAANPALRLDLDHQQADLALEQPPCANSEAQENLLRARAEAEAAAARLEAASERVLEILMRQREARPAA